MKALRVIAIALLTAIAGAVLSIAASLYLTELYHVSDFEGGRGMLIFFALAPLGFIVGLIIGLIVALLSRGTGFSGFGPDSSTATASQLLLPHAAEFPQHDVAGVAFKLQGG